MNEEEAKLFGELCADMTFTKLAQAKFLAPVVIAGLKRFGKRLFLDKSLAEAGFKSLEEVGTLDLAKTFAHTLFHPEVGWSHPVTRELAGELFSRPATWGTLYAGHQILTGRPLIPKLRSD